jgi:serine/threonine-protein kinase
VSIALLGAASVVGYFAWTKYLRPQVFTPVVASTASAPTASAATSDSSTPLPVVDLPPWVATIEQGQQLLTGGDGDAAIAKFKEAKGQGAGAVAQSFIDNVTVGKATTGPCKLVAFSHPRLGIGGNIGRPTIAAGPKGGVVAWTDDHEVARTMHAWAVALDQIGRPTSRPLDLTPEGDTVWRPSLFAVQDRIALLYWDKSGNGTGVRVRWLDGDGRIASSGGASVLVSDPPRQGDMWPTMDRAPNGTFWVAWEEDRDKEGNDLFLRHLDKDLQPLAPEIRVTDYVAPEKAKVGPQIDDPSIGISGKAIFLTYSLERDKQRLLERMRIQLDAPELTGTGLDEKPASTPVPGGGTEKRKDRELVQDVTVVNDDKVAAYYPDTACGKDGCFIVWHEAKGAHAAMFDTNKGIVVWHKRLAAASHPALGVSADGQVRVSFYEAGKVRIAALSRDGIGTTSTFGKVSTEQPRPWVGAGGTRGDWYVTWQDIESGHTEAFVARLACRD